MLSLPLLLHPAVQQGWVVWGARLLLGYGAEAAGRGSECCCPQMACPAGGQWDLLWGAGLKGAGEGA